MYFKVSFSRYTIPDCFGPASTLQSLSEEKQTHCQRQRVARANRCQLPNGLFGKINTKFSYYIFIRIGNRLTSMIHLVINLRGLVEVIQKQG